MANEPTLTPNPQLPGSDIGWNCTSADGKICVYGRTEEEAKMRCKLARDWSRLSRAQKIEMERAALGGEEQKASGESK